MKYEYLGGKNNKINTRRAKHKRQKEKQGDRESRKYRNNSKTRKEGYVVEKKKLAPAGIEMKLAGVFMLLAFVTLEVVSRLGVYNYITDYWLRAIVGEIMISIPILVFLYMGSRQFVPMIRINPVKIRVILFAVLIEICLMPVMGLCNVITQSFTENTVMTSIGSMMGETPYGLMVIAMCFVPALVEEITFRGIVFSAFKRSGRPLAAGMMTGLCFALLHGNINQFAYAFIVGVAMCIVVDASDSILTSFGMHFITNTITVTSLYYLNGILVAEAQSRELFGGGDNKMAEIIYADGMEALLGGVIAAVYITLIILAVAGLFAVYRMVGYIATVCGRYEYINSYVPQFWIFRLRSRSKEEIEEDKARKTKENRISDLPCTKILNPMLVAGIGLWLAVMVVYELILQGVIKT